jgi:hypothetical protein
LANRADGAVGGREGRRDLVRVRHAGWLHCGPSILADFYMLVRCYNLKGRWRL